MSSFDAAVANVLRWADGPPPAAAAAFADVPQLPIPVAPEPTAVGSMLTNAAASAATTAGVFAVGVVAATALLPGPARPSLSGPSLAPADHRRNVGVETVLGRDGIGGWDGRTVGTALMATAVP